MIGVRAEVDGVTVVVGNSRLLPTGAELQARQNFARLPERGHQLLKESQ